MTATTSSVDISNHPTANAEPTMHATEKSAFTFLPLGAILQRFQLGDLNIVQGFDSAGDYVQHNSPYFGETIGRVANRISGARISRLNGRSYPLTANNGPNTLHGGVKGWGKQVFEGPTSVTRGGRESIQFQYRSNDGEEGFPGSVETRVFYTASTAYENGNEVAVLEMEYEAELVGDEDVAETAVAMTNHSYFNLAGLASIEGTEVILSTNLHQEVDEESIPTGNISPFPGVEANKMFVLGPQEPDIDHCFILNSDPSSVKLDTRESPLCLLAKFHHPKSGAHLEVLSTEPAFQFYTGKYIDVPPVGKQPARGRRSGFCVEPSRYINAINEDKWRDMVVLTRGHKYGSRLVYRAWKDVRSQS